MIRYPTPTVGSAAVAIIQCFQDTHTVLLLRRVSHPEDPWSGHFSFPGGRRDRGDADLLATSIRETREETGIPLRPDYCIGKMELEPAGRNFKTLLWVRPFLFTLPAQQEIIIEPKEIQSSHWLDVTAFRDLDRHRQVEMLPDRFFPAYPLEDYYVWGFTYRLLCKVLAVPSW